jgi:hypothetical protein
VEIARNLNSLRPAVRSHALMVPCGGQPWISDVSCSVSGPLGWEMLPCRCHITGLLELSPGGSRSSVVCSGIRVDVSLPSCTLTGLAAGSIVTSIFGQVDPGVPA